MENLTNQRRLEMKALLALALLVALLAIGKSVHADKLHDAAAAGDVARIQTMLKAGANVNARKPPVFGETALHAAAHNGHTAAVDVLLKAGANVNARSLTTGGRTALHDATFNGHVAVVEVLLKAGASVHVEDNFGMTPLHDAAADGDAAAVEILLKAGANVNAKDENTWTALHYAAVNGHVAAVEVLLIAGVNVNAKDMNGETALQLAVQRGHGAAVRKAAERVGDKAAAARAKAKKEAERLRMAACPFRVCMGDRIRSIPASEKWGEETRPYRGSLPFEQYTVQGTRKDGVCAFYANGWFQSKEQALSKYDKVLTLLLRFPE